MLYWLKVYSLFAAFVFSGAGFIILILLVWNEVKKYASAQRRIYQRLASLLAQPQLFTSPVVISRTFSRVDQPVPLSLHKIQ